jgi:hypothetical protein
MPTHAVGTLTFAFPAGWLAEPFDELPFYRKRFNGLAGSKAVDLIAVAPGDQAVWLIEVKDYRNHRRTKTAPLVDEFAAKVRDSLACIPCMAVNADGMRDVTIAKAALRSSTIRIVLHVEQARKPSKLFPWVADPKTVRDQVRRLVRAADPKALVGDSTTLAPHVAWTVT